MSKKLFVVFVLGVLFAGFLVSALSHRVAQAGFFDTFFDFFLQSFSEPSSSSSTTPVAPKAPVELYKPALDYEEAVVRAVEVASPSVVSIAVSKDLPVIENCPYSPFGNLPPEFRDFFGFPGLEFSQPCEKGTKRQEVGGGSGFIVSADGLILTNKHVVNDTKADYTVLTNDGKKYDAKVLARDPLQDLAIIKISASGLVPANLGDSGSVKLGQTAIAIGNSLGEFRNTVSVGVVSGLSRTITASGGGASETIQGVIQTDAAINPGNSGGPLLNLKGEVIGINTAIASGAQNIGFAIPINQAKRDVDSVKKDGSIKTAYVGVRYIIVTPEVKEKQGLSVDYGALVRGTEDGPAVIPGSPAAKAGLLAEDIILEFGGEKVSQEKPLGLLVQQYNVGEQVDLKVQRGKQALTFKLTLEERPEL